MARKGKQHEIERAGNGLDHRSGLRNMDEGAHASQRWMSPARPVSLARLGRRT